MLDESQMIRSCIAHCKNTASDIRNLSMATQDFRAKDELDKAYLSLDTCIKQCEGALYKVQYGNF